MRSGSRRKSGSGSSDSKDIPPRSTGPLDRLPDVEIVAYWDSGGKKQAKLGSAKQYSDWRDMLDREKLDVVAVTNNNGERAGAIVEAAKRKIHVVAEKPLAIDQRVLPRSAKPSSATGSRSGCCCPCDMSRDSWP